MIKLRPRMTLSSVAIVVVILASCSDSGNKPDDPEPLPTISVNDVSVAEGGLAQFKVSLSEVSTAPVRFTYATSNFSAISPSDYLAASGTDTIAVGDTTATVIVATFDDDEAVPDETFLVKITAVSGATLGDSVGVGTILDSDLSFASQVRPLLQTSCAKTGGLCHGGGSSAGGMALGSAEYASVIAAKSNIVGPGAGDSLVVQPYNSAASMLYLRTTAIPPFGLGRMPNTPPYLSLSQQALIRDWIDQGAHDN
jgi:hypothetical protein